MRPTDHEPRDRAVAGQRSRATIAEELERELAGVRVFQLYVRHLGPGDVVYVSAFARDARDHVVEAKASAMTFRAALTQLFANLDQATAPEEA